MSTRRMVPTTERWKEKQGGGKKICEFSIFNIWSLGYVRENYTKKSSQKKKKKSIYGPKDGKGGYTQDTGL